MKSLLILNTFFATAEAVWIAGAKVVFVDCDPRTKCIDPSKIEAAITRKTKSNYPSFISTDNAPIMTAISKIAEKHKLFVIEDNAQAIDACGRQTSNRENSRMPSPQVSSSRRISGASAMAELSSPTNPQIDEKVRKLRNHGSARRDNHSFGFNSRLDDMQAGVLSAKLKHLVEWSNLRIKLAKRLHGRPQ